MEPTKASIVFKATVVAVEEKFNDRWLHGVGPDAVFAKDSMGWFVGLSGSYEWIHVGRTAPDISVGDTATVRISFE